MSPDKKQILTTISSVIIKNRDDTNFITVGYDEHDGTSVTSKCIAGQILVLGPILTSGEIQLTADTSNVNCEVVVCGD